MKLFLTRAFLEGKILDSALNDIPKLIIVMDNAIKWCNPCLQFRQSEFEKTEYG